MNPFNTKEKNTMNTSILISAIVAGALSAPIASAQDEHAHEKLAVSADMNRDKDMDVSRMRARMQVMQAQMDTIRNTTDPAQRQRLMQEHMQTMQENMMTMRATGGPMMQDGGRHRGMMMGGAKDGMTGSDMMKHHAMMEQRMDMMQMMMEQMIQRDQMTGSMPAR
jgi:hypothetical protein